MEIRISEQCAEKCYWKDRFLTWAEDSTAAVEQVASQPDVNVNYGGSFICEGYRDGVRATMGKGETVAKFAICQAECVAPRVEKVLAQDGNVDLAVPVKISGPPDVMRLFQLY